MPSQMLEAAVSAIYHVTVLHGRTAITYSLLYSLPESLMCSTFFIWDLAVCGFLVHLALFSEIETDLGGFLFFLSKGVWRRSNLQSIIWFSVESSKTFQERMSPPLAWKSVDFVVSGLLPDFSEIAEHVQLLPNSLVYRENHTFLVFLKLPPSLSSSYWITRGIKL